MTVLYKAPNKAPEIIDIDNTLEALQAAVDGPVESLTICTDAVILCNEEALFTDKAFNCRLCGVQFFGPILVCGCNGDEFTDLKVPKVVMRLFGWS